MVDYGLQSLAENPDLFVRIAENALLTAKELREDYIGTTVRVARSMRSMFESGDPCGVAAIRRSKLEPRTVAFVDGGLSRIDVEFATPLIVRAGIFRVKEGESDLLERETFMHYPLFLGELAGGLKTENSYGDVVRLIVELGALLSALTDPQFADVSFLMLHGPLVFVKAMYSKHWFFESDYRLMLGPASASEVGERLIDSIKHYCEGCPTDRSESCAYAKGGEQLPAVCVMTSLQAEVVSRAADRGVILCGVVERPEGRALVSQVLAGVVRDHPEALSNAVARLRLSGLETDSLVSQLLEATRYTDALLLAMTLRPGEALSWMPLRRADSDDRLQRLPGFVQTFVRPSASKYPIRIEAPAAYGAGVLDEIVLRCFDYASLLPNYAFPVGLDIVDKYTSIPSWMSQAYYKMILVQYGRIISGDVADMDDLDSVIRLVSGGAEMGRNKESRPEV